MSQGEQSNPHGQPPYASDESLVINTRLNEIERQQREEKAEEREYKSRQLATNGLMALFTGLLFVTSVISDVILIRQAVITKESADAAKSAAKTASAAFAQSKIDSAAQDKRSRETMETSAKQSKAALDASIEISRTDQRAWLGYQEVTDVALTSADISSKMVIWYINTGKTPALEFKGHASTKLVYPGQVFVPEYPKASDEPSMSYVMPEQRAHIQIGSTAPWDPAAIAALKSGLVTLYVFSEICYKDIFGAQHHSTFCGHVMPPELTGVATCGTYNEADDKPTDFCKSRQPTR